MLGIPRSNNRLCFVGIDPGVKGALVAIDEDRTVLVRATTPLLNAKSSGKSHYDLQGMLSVLRRLSNFGRVFCHIEKSQAMPRDSRPSAWKTGCGFGYWEMGLTACRIPYSIIGPRTWQKVLHKNLPDSDTKTKSIIAAQRLLPDLNLMRTDRARKPDHNIADAALLALHCMRENSRLELNDV